VGNVRVLPLVLASAVLALGCQQRQTDGEPEEGAADTAAMMETGDEMAGDEMAGGGATSLADLAGTWNMRAVPESGDDTTAVTFRMEVAGDRLTLMLPERDPLETVVSTSGDSVVVEAGPYESIRREGVTVRTRSAFQLEGDRLVGTIVARYETSGADSVTILRSEGTRAP
jgi:hypothetical protein